MVMPRGEDAGIARRRCVGGMMVGGGRIGMVLSQTADTAGGQADAILALERTLLSIENRYYDLISPDRSLDHERLEQYNKICETGFDFDTIPELWFLSTVAVDPVHQRRGLGRLLVQWGLDRAQEEQASVALDASLHGIGLYEALGFRTVDTVEVVPGLKVPSMLWESV